MTPTARVLAEMVVCSFDSHEWLKRDLARFIEGTQRLGGKSTESYQVGEDHDGKPLVLHLRDCAKCHSTLARRVRKPVQP